MPPRVGNFTGTGNWDIMAGGSWNNGGLYSRKPQRLHKDIRLQLVTGNNSFYTPQDVEVFPTNSTEAKHIQNRHKDCRGILLIGEPSKRWI